MLFFLPHLRHISRVKFKYFSSVVQLLYALACGYCSCLVLRNTEFWTRLQAGFSQSLMSQLAFKSPRTVRQKAGKKFYTCGTLASPSWIQSQ